MDLFLATRPNEFVERLSFLFIWAWEFSCELRVIYQPRTAGSARSSTLFHFFPHVLTKHWYFSWEGKAGKGCWGVQVGQRGFGGQISKDVSVFRMTNTLIDELSNLT